MTTDNEMNNPINEYSTRINVESVDPTCLKIDYKEVLRYLGVLDHSECSEEIVSSFSVELKQVIRPKVAWRYFDLAIDNGVISFSDMKIKSTSLEKNLSGCCGVVLFCATLGLEVDRMIRTKFATSSANGVVLNSVATSYTESLCDLFNSKIIDLFGETRPRFSCGYGDYSIEYQKNIIRILEAEKNIGVYCTDSFMMIPSKSVTAIIGVKG